MLTAQEIQEKLSFIQCGDSFSWDDIDAIRNLAQKLPKGIKILEIGSLCGKSACVWSLLTKGKVWTIDINDNRQLIKENAKRAGAKVIPLVGNSANFNWNKKVDVVWIDGDHSASALIKDLRKYERYAKTLICGHDYTYEPSPDVKMVVDAYYPNVQTDRSVWYKFIDSPLITIISLLSERKYCVDEWLKGMEDLDFDKSKMNVVWFVSGKDQDYQNKLSLWAEKYRGEYHSFKIIFSDKEIYRFKINQDGNEKVDGQIADNYNDCRQYIHTKYTLFWEDDIVPPPDALTKLLKLMKGKVSIASGKAHFRPSTGFDETKLLAWDYKSEKTFGLKDSSPELCVEMWALDDTKNEGVDFVGGIHFGFTLLRSDFVKNYTFTGTLGNLVSFCDMVAGYYINKMGKKVALDRDLTLKHIDG